MADKPRDLGAIFSASANDGFPKTITLPVSGVEATILKRPQAAEMRTSQKMARKGRSDLDLTGYQLATIHQVVRFGEEQQVLRIDQLEPLTEPDIGALMAAIGDDSPLSSSPDET